MKHKNVFSTHTYTSIWHVCVGSEGGHHFNETIHQQEAPLLLMIRHQIAHLGRYMISIWCLSNTTMEKDKSYTTVVLTICCWKQFLINMAQVLHLGLR